MFRLALLSEQGLCSDQTFSKLFVNQQRMQPLPANNLSPHQGDRPPKAPLTIAFAPHVFAEVFVEVFVEKKFTFCHPNLIAGSDNNVHHIYTEDSDAVLVVAIGRGQQRALAEIYRRHGGQAFRLAERLLVDAKRAEDVVQDVFLQLWRDPESFDAERASLRTWLLLKTHGKAVDLIRAEAARRGREDRLLNDRTNDQLDLDREIWDLTVADRVQQALGELPENERQVITLAYFGGRTYTEVAEALGQPEGTVKSRIRKGLTTLRRSLGDLRFDGERNENAGTFDPAALAGLDQRQDHIDPQLLSCSTNSPTSNRTNTTDTTNTTNTTNANGTLDAEGQWSSTANNHHSSAMPGTSQKGEKQS